MCCACALICVCVWSLFDRTNTENLTKAWMAAKAFHSHSDIHIISFNGMRRTGTWRYYSSNDSALSWSWWDIVFSQSHLFDCTCILVGLIMFWCTGHPLHYVYFIIFRSSARSLVIWDSDNVKLLKKLPSADVVRYVAIPLALCLMEIIKNVSTSEFIS